MRERYFRLEASSESLIHPKAHGVERMGGRRDWMPSKFKFLSSSTSVWATR